MQLKTCIAVLSLICLLAVSAASMDGDAYCIYDQFGYGIGGDGNIYYGGGVFDGTFYTGQIFTQAQQWRDEQIFGNALMNATPAKLQPFSPANLAKVSFPLGGYIYMGNGGGQIVQTPSWSSTAFREVAIPAGTTCECICTDGTYIYMTNASSGGRHKVYKFSVNHAAATVTLEPGWPVTITDSATPGVNPRFRGISYYNGKLYVVNHLGTQGGPDVGIFEIDTVSGSWARIADHPVHSTGGQDYGGSLSWDNAYQVVRYGNQLFTVGLDDKLRTYQFDGTTWTLAKEKDLGLTDLYGIGVTGDGTTAKYAWVTHLPGKCSFWDLDVHLTPGTLGDARKIKNGYPSKVEIAVVTKHGDGGFWVEAPDRSAAVFVNASIDKYVPVGNEVDLWGSITQNENGEKVFNGVATDHGPAEEPIKPLYLNNKDLKEPRGIGVATDGMLVKVTGRCTKVDIVEGDIPTAFVYFDDGSGLASDIPDITGVKTQVTEVSPILAEAFMNPSGYEVTVTGIVRLKRLADGTIIRKIDALSDADVIIAPIE